MTYIALAIAMVVAIAVSLGFAVIAIGDMNVDDDYEPL